MGVSKRTIQHACSLIWIFFLIRYSLISSSVSSERIKNTLQCSTLGIGWQKYSSGPPVHPMLLVVSSWASTLKIDSLPNFKSKKTVNKNKKRKKKHFNRSVSNGCEIDLSDFAESVMEQKQRINVFLWRERDDWTFIADFRSNNNQALQLQHYNYHLSNIGWLYFGLRPNFQTKSQSSLWSHEPWAVITYFAVKVSTAIKKPRNFKTHAKKRIGHFFSIRNDFSSQKAIDHRTAQFF